MTRQAGLTPIDSRLRLGVSRNMPTPDPEPWLEFFHRAEPNLARRCSARFSCLCVELDGQWFNLAATVLLGPIDPATTSPIRLEALGLRAIDGVIPFEKVEPLIRRIWGEGYATPAELPEGLLGNIYFRDPDQNVPYRNWRSGEFAGPDARGLKWSHWKATVSGPSFNRIADYSKVADLNRVLPARTTPFSSLDHLAKHIGILHTVQSESNVSVQFVSPLWARFKDVRVNQTARTVCVTTESRWTDPSTSVALALFRDGDPNPGTSTAIHQPLDVGGVGANCIRVSTDLMPVTDVGPWTVSLNVGGHQIETRRTGLGRMSLVAHELFDPDCARLLARVQGKSKRDAEGFEEGVAWLLHLLGFQATQTGQKDVEGVDVIAILEERGVAYIECSIEVPSDDKLTRLKARAERFRVAIKERQSQEPMVLALFATSLRRAHVPLEKIDQIRDQRIGLLCGEELEELVLRAQRGEDPVLTFAHLASLTQNETTRDFMANLAFDQLMRSR